jgi:predicted nucleic acid-binding Zn ribbon protein
MAVIPKPYNNFKLGPPKTDARQHVLAQWRGMDVAPLEIARAVRTRKVADIMPKVFVDMRMDKRRAEAEVVKVWNSLIDPGIVAHAQPTGLHKGTLFVTVDSSPWLDEIVRYRRKEILNRLQSSFGTEVIAKISFRVG